MKVFHIVPRIPPAIDGLGDFATCLGATLHRCFGVESEFLAADPAQPVPNYGRILRERSPVALLREVLESRCEVVFLHFSGYGFDHCGAPKWVADALSDLDDTRTIVVFFHELWASGPPWRSPFYYSFAQKRIVRRLKELADCSFVSASIMQRRLDEFGGAPAIWSPVPSNIPAAAPARKDGSKLTGIVFGQEHTRERSVRAHAALLRNIGSQLDSLRLIGRSANSQSSDAKLARAIVGDSRVTTVSDAPPEQVAHELAHADFFLSYYPAEYMTKSGTIMAAFASGCPVILPAQKAIEQNLPVIISDGVIAREDLEKTAQVALDWYERNASWDRLAERMASLFKVCEEPLAQAR